MDRSALHTSVNTQNASGHRVPQCATIVGRTTSFMPLPPLPQRHNLQLHISFILIPIPSAMFSSSLFPITTLHGTLVHFWRKWHPVEIAVPASFGLSQNLFPNVPINDNWHTNTLSLIHAMIYGRMCSDSTPSLVYRVKIPIHVQLVTIASMGVPLLECMAQCGSIGQSIHMHLHLSMQIDS